MKKTLKLLLIFMGSFIVILVGGIGGYNLIMSNQTFYIYDLRFVVPDENARGYIYTKNGENYRTMASTERHMKSDEENYLEIAVYVSTSNGNTNIDITSSDESVAKIEYRNNKCYVNYLKAGEATITTTMGTVSDSFVIDVYDKIPSGFRVYDLAYYGENYAKREDYTNSLVCYSDERTALEYSYGYELFDEAGNVDTEFFNNGRLEIDQSSLTDGYFDEVSLDTTNKKLKIVCKQQDLVQSVNTSIAVKSFSVIDGKKYLEDIFEINVYIIANEVEFVQVELSTNPDFTNKSIYLNIDNVNYSDDLSSEDLLSYLTSQRVEENLALAGENEVYDVYITEKTPEIYMKFRLVYTNGTILELDQSNMNEYYTVFVEDRQMLNTNSHLYLSEDNQNYLECEPMGEYFILKLNTNYMSSRASGKITLRFEFLGEFQDLALNATENLKVFDFEYLDLSNEEDVKKLYKLNDDGSYTFDYWDKRTICDQVVYDENGNVVEFLV